MSGISTSQADPVIATWQTLKGNYDFRRSGGTDHTYSLWVDIKPRRIARSTQNLRHPNPVDLLFLFKKQKKRGSDRLIHRWIDQVEDVNMRSSVGHSLLMIATAFKWVHVASHIASRLEQEYKTRKACLNRFFCPDLSQEIESYFSTFEQKDKEGNSVLHLSVRDIVLKETEKAQVMIQRLIECGAPINPLNHLHQSPLHLAARSGNLSVVRFLTEHGGRLDIKDKGGRTPLDLAKFHRHKAVVEFLEILNQREVKDVNAD